MKNVCNYNLLHVLKSVLRYGLLYQLDLRKKFNFITYHQVSGLCYSIPGNSKFFTAKFAFNSKTSLCLPVTVSCDTSKFNIYRYRFGNGFDGKFAGKFAFIFGDGIVCADKFYLGMFCCIKK